MSDGTDTYDWSQVFETPYYGEALYDLYDLGGMTVDGVPISWTDDGGINPTPDPFGLSLTDPAGSMADIDAAMADIDAAMAEINAMFAGMQVEQTTGDLYLNGQRVGGAADTQALVGAIGSSGGAGTEVPGVGGQDPQKSWLEGVWAAIPASLKSALPQAAILLGLGGASLGISRAVAPGGHTATIPPVPGASPQQLQAQAALTNALTNRPTVPLPGAPPTATGVPGTTTGTPPPPGFPTTTIGGTTIDPTGAFGATGQENLESVFRSGLAGQSLAAQLATLQTSRELSTTAEMAPYEDALRMMAISQVPQFMTPAGGSTWTRTVPSAGGSGGGMPSSAIARLIASRGAPGGPAGSDPNLDRAWAAIEAALAGGG